MGKKKRPGRKDTQISSTAEDLRARARQALDRGKGRQALDAAKDLAKQEPGEETDALLLEAYRARITELSEAGLTADARRLIEAVKERFPSARPTLDSQELRVGARSGDLDPLLRSLLDPGIDRDRRRRLTDLLARSVRDPAEVADSGVLPPGHPLRREAAAAAALLERAASGPLDPGDPALTVVPRRSPLAPFVLLARAIDAAHAGDAGEVDEFLARIPEDTAASRAAPALRALAARQLAPDASPAARRLLEATLGADRALGPELRRLEEMVLGDREEAAIRLAATLLRRVRDATPGLLPEFRRVLATAWAARDLDPAPLGDLLGRKGGGPAEYYRVSALAMEREEFQDEAILFWEDWIAMRGRQASALEVALVRERQSQLAGVMGLQQGFDRLRDLVEDPPDDLDREEALRTVDCGQELALDYMEQAVRYMEQAVRARPSARNYAQLHRLARLHPSREAARDVALRWRDAHPGDVESYVALAGAETACEGDEDVVLGLLARASELAPHDPRIRNARREALVHTIRRALRAGDRETARRQIRGISGRGGSSDPGLGAFRHMLEWFAAEDGAERSVSYERLADELGDAPARYLLHVAAPELGGGSQALALPARPEAAPPRGVAHMLATAWRVLEAGGLEFPGDRPMTIALNRALGQGFEPDEPDMEPLVRLYLELELVGGLHHLSRIGLAGRSNRVPFFLLARARGLGRAKGRAARRRECLRAARELARRVGDEEVVREAGAELAEWGRLPELDPGLAERILARERQAGLGDAPGHRGGTVPKGQGRLFT